MDYKLWSDGSDSVIAQTKDQIVPELVRIYGGKESDFSSEWFREVPPRKLVSVYDEDKEITLRMPAVQVLEYFGPKVQWVGSTEF